MRNSIRQVVATIMAFAIVGSLCGCDNLDDSDYQYQSDYSNEKSLKDLQTEIDDSLQDWEDSQDEFYEALEQDRQDYVREASQG